MEYGLVRNLNDGNQHNTRKEVSEPLQSQVKPKDDPKHAGKDVEQLNTGSSKGVGNVSEGEVQGLIDDASGEVNLEASISSDDVIRAGGFGARDDIGSFLPVASDSTDLEASLLNARGYEDPQEEKCRPGLGWTEASNYLVS